MRTVSLCYPIAIKPLAALLPMFCGLQCMRPEYAEIHSQRIDAPVGFFDGKDIHPVPAVFRKLFGTAIYHADEFRQPQEISVKHKNNAPEK